jgi:methylenetetrahydrofolate reductase (NADPH)
MRHLDRMEARNYLGFDCGGQVIYRREKVSTNVKYTQYNSHFYFHVSSKPFCAQLALDNRFLGAGTMKRDYIQYTERMRDLMPEERTASSSMTRMLRGYSIEINLRQPGVLDAAVERLDRGTEVFLVWIPGADPLKMVGPASSLRRAGLVPVPHVAARHLESSGQLIELAARLAGEAGVDRILLVGGDRARPAGPYDASLGVMQTDVFQNAGITRMALGGFPEGNPNISLTALEQAFAAKLNFGRRTGLELSIVTQFCFKAEPIVSWLQRIRARGIDNPVRVGLAGPASLGTLARYAVRCGIGNSLHVLREYPSVAKLLTEKGPAPIIRDIADTAPETNSSVPLGITGFHFFAFGGFTKTIDWINAERAH